MSQSQITIFSALAEPTRFSIYEMLANRGQLSASDIFKKFEVSNPSISQHLKVLREAELVQVEKRAQQRLYQINPQKIEELERWIIKMKRLWDERFERLDHVLKNENKTL